MARHFELVELTDSEFDCFSETHSQGNFQQTSSMAQMHQRTNKVDCKYLGVRECTDESSELVAAMLFATHHGWSTFCTIYDGPLLDYTDHELVKFTFSALKPYAKKNGGTHVWFTPEVIYQLRSTDGTVPSGTKPNQEVVELLCSLGCIHKGFTLGYDAIPRWRYVKDLNGISTSAELLSLYDKRTQWSVKRAIQMGVHVREMRQDELSIFTKIESQTAERRHFAKRSHAYFEHLFKSFDENVHFLVAEIHVSEYTTNIQKKYDELTKIVAQAKSEHEKIPSHKKAARLREETANLAAAKKRLDTAIELRRQGDIIPIAVACFIAHPREMVYLFSGSLPEYNSFYGPALMQHYMMTRTLELGINRYNFYGITGVFNNPDDEGAGVLTFKQGFNGYVEELIGEFILPTKPLQYKIKQIAKKILKK